MVTEDKSTKWYEKKKLDEKIIIRVAAASSSRQGFLKLFPYILAKSEKEENR